MTEFCKRCNTHNWHNVEGPGSKSVQMYEAALSCAERFNGLCGFGVEFRSFNLLVRLLGYEVSES